MPMATESTLRFLIAILFLLTAFPCNAGFTSVTDAQWDNLAVRKVLHTFAYGGFATDAQIQTWADMTPNVAIAQILTFAPTNEALSPAQDNVLETKLFINGTDRTLEGLQDFWSSNSDVTNPVPSIFRSRFNVITQAGDSFNAPSLTHTWLSATNQHGINPFRQRVGFWLTNYHVAVHMGAIDNNVPMLKRLYDSYMALLAQGTSLDQVLSLGANSAALAMQYGHKNNTYDAATTRFRGNDDFAREFHQLLFSITGDSPDSSTDPVAYKNYYENITIENTARALTGMQIAYLPVALPGANFSAYADSIDFSSTENIVNHHTADLEILNFPSPGIANISGQTAQNKLQTLARIAIDDPESLQRLPLAIISYFADDNLTPRSENNPDLLTEIQTAWQASNKNLLEFLRAYATSTQFHSSSRIKYLSAFERNIIALNQNTVDNNESHASNVTSLMLTRMNRQGASPFQPAHFIFGGQTGRDAFENTDTFKDAYNASICIENPDGNCVDGWNTLASTSNTATGWTKHWEAIIPASLGNQASADALAHWLWNRFIGDAGKDYGPQERAHLTCLLAHGLDLPTFLAQQTGSPIQENGFSTSDLTSPTAPYSALIDAAAATVIDFTNTLNLPDINTRIGLAVNFITATPFMFVEEGR